MKSFPVGRVVLAVVAYLIAFVIGASSGLIHPACFAYAGTFMPILLAFVYLYVASNVQGFGAAAAVNLLALVIAFVVGEGNVALAVGLVVFAAIAEVVRRACGYDTLKGVRLSFIPFAFSFYAYSAHWWTETAGSLQAAVEEMPAGYADMMAPVIANTPLLVIMLVLTVPVAVLAMRLAEKVMRKQVAVLA